MDEPGRRRGPPALGLRLLRSLRYGSQRRPTIQTVRLELSRERGNGGNGHTDEKWMQSSWPGSSGAHSHDREHSWQVISPTVPSCTSMDPLQFGQGKEMIVAPNANKLAMVDCLQRLMNKGNAELICMIRANIETGAGFSAAWSIVASPLLGHKREMISRPLDWPNWAGRS